MFNIFLILLYSFIISSSILMISVLNPINSVLFLISIFFAVSIVFILLGIDFFGFIFLIIYVGAIAVLFLFIVMMLNIQKIETDKFTYLTIGVFILIILFMELFLSLSYNYLLIFDSNKVFFTMENIRYIYNIFVLKSDEYYRFLMVESLGVMLFEYYPIQLMLSGLNLLVAMIGSIFLTNFKRGFSTKKQYNQLARNHYLINSNIY
ncbi:MAG: nad6, PhpafMp24 [Haloplasmataceae bacterium]|nr:nad6, PhpafMp24 [Haloplasmataceae bacterium]